MIRNAISPRPDWRAKVEQWGLLFHTEGDQPYWHEEAYYEFSESEILQLEDATNELHGMCLKAVEKVVSEHLYSRLGIPPMAWPLIERSWRRQDPSLYGRFDLAYDGKNPPKLLEYNADTPTALLEAAVIQWHWLEELYPNADQFNSIWEGLVAQWDAFKSNLAGGPLHFSAADSIEDEMTVTMLMDTAQEAGITAEYLGVQEIGWHPQQSVFVDMKDRPIATLFKLYPWEWLVAESFGHNIAIAEQRTHWVEPIWKLVLSSKGILAILWEMFPDHPMLLETLIGTSGSMTAYVKKPLFGREGANVQIMDGGILEETSGEYGAEGYVFQRYQQLPVFAGAHAQIGSWVIGDEARGIGVRESDGFITTNTSRFVPHLFR